jgi:hypothetical protein
MRLLAIATALIVAGACCWLPAVASARDLQFAQSSRETPAPQSPKPEPPGAQTPSPGGATAAPGRAAGSPEKAREHPSAIRTRHSEILKGRDFKNEISIMTAGIQARPDQPLLYLGRGNAYRMVGD